eukprot:TRINITY_DN13724_c0_g1_i3.p1 TRINITY_DN13724_c0_g1~~TRINITY_DN13724_c0_g1_i3.p1  ORF type:complete len:219 (+),score=57.37 TRINITY_DN13724_c0_g1_i3:231-887(+)
MELLPPDKFSMVEDGVYRSNAITAANFDFIKRLGLRTVVLLSPEMPLRALTDFLKHQSVQLIELGLRIWSPDSKAVSEEMVKEALEFVLDASCHPLLIMCSSGVHRTGVVFGCLRRLERWSVSAVIEEYRSFASDETARYINEQFIDCFDLDLVHLPEHLPEWWLYQQELLHKENSIESAPAESPSFERHYMNVTGPLISSPDAIPKSSKSKLKKANK